MDDKFVECLMSNITIEDVGIAMDEVTGEVTFLTELYHKFLSGEYSVKEFIAHLEFSLRELQEKTLSLNAVYEKVYEKMEEI